MRKAQWNSVLSSRASSIPPASGCSFRFLKFPAGSGTRYGSSLPVILRPNPDSLVCQFTITSAPEDPYVSVHIRQVGDFTRAVGERLGAGPSVVAAMTQAAMKGAEVDDKDRLGTRGDFIELDANATTKALPVVRIDGPYGAPAEDVFNVEVAILIGAGIGELEMSLWFGWSFLRPLVIQV